MLHLSKEALIPMNNAILLDSKAVEEMTSLKSWTIRRLVHKKRFPKPHKPTGNLNYWRLTDVENWISEACDLKEAK